MGEGTVFSLSVHTQEGGSQVQVQVQVGGGFPGPGPGGGTQSQVRGGTWSQIWGGYPVSGLGGVPGPGGRGVPGLRSGRGGYPVSVKGTIFDTRFGLIHVQTGEKIFC